MHSGFLLFCFTLLPGLSAADGAPVITREPVSQIAQKLGSVTFSATASGTPPLTYQWRRDGNAWPTWNTPTITLEGVSENDLGIYTLTVTNDAGSVTSQGAALTFGAPVIVKDLAEKPVTVGKRLLLGIEAIGRPAPTFQWKKDGVNLFGTNVPSLSFDSVNETHAGTYMVVVSNPLGVVTSKSIVLSVDGDQAKLTLPAVATPPPAPEPPATEKKPAESAPPPPPPPPKPGRESGPPVAVTAGKTITLDATTEGTPPFKFQWLKNGQPIRGATKISLELAKVSAADTGVYICIVSNAAGTTRSPPFNLKVSPP